jgi:hypothetical protein
VWPRPAAAPAVAAGGPRSRGRRRRPWPGAPVDPGPATGTRNKEPDWWSDPPDPSRYGQPVVSASRGSQGLDLALRRRCSGLAGGLQGNCDRQEQTGDSKTSGKSTTPPKQTRTEDNKYGRGPYRPKLGIDRAGRGGSDDTRRCDRHSSSRPGAGQGRPTELHHHQGDWVPFRN